MINTFSESKWDQSVSDQMQVNTDEILTAAFLLKVCSWLHFVEAI